MLSELREHSKILGVFSISIVLSLMLYAKANASDSPAIEFTYVPPCGSDENLKGQASNIIPGDYKVAGYIRVGGGWWNKPTWANPLTPIQGDGSWTCDITTGGNDPDATEIAAYLVPNGYTPPEMSGQCALPHELDENSEAKVKTMRSCGYRKIVFSGYNWRVKSSDSKVGPGPNYFSDSEENVWVDDQGRLHLKITQRDNEWYCAEVILEENFGYGKYIFHLAKRVDQLNENVVLGLFTWDTCSDPTYGNREIDIEFSRWEDPANDNAQFVVQPYDTPGNMHRFNMQQSEEESTHSFTWLEDRIKFQSIYDDSTELSTYTGQDIPQPGNENARINLWLSNGLPPSDGQEVEVVIKQFDYRYPSGDVSGDGKITAYDAALILQYVVGLIDELPVELNPSSSGSVPPNYSLSIPHLTVKASDKVYAPIHINDTTGLSFGGITLRYDSTVLKVIDVLPTTTLSGSYWKANTNLDGEVRFAFAATQPMKGQGNLLLVEFEALPNTEGRTSQLILDNLEFANSLSIANINGAVTILPSKSALLQNYPNPFNPETWLPYQLAIDSPATISIYNAKGQLIRSISLSVKKAGVYRAKGKAGFWDGKDSFGQTVASGVYFYTLQAGNFTATRRMLVVK